MSAVHARGLSISDLNRMGVKQMNRTRVVPKVANYINHIALVLDASDSMRGKVATELVKVADAQIAYLAQRSKEMDQETRITVYTFSGYDQIECVIYDKDVLRLPSIASYYKTYMMTALLDATALSLDDLAMTPEKYGDHAFLVYVLTDGMENNSRKTSRYELSAKLNALPDHWTVAVLVPDMRGKHDAKTVGFPADNIAIWDATSDKGVVEAGATIRQATDNFMTNRSLGIRGTKTLFSTGTEAVNKVTIKEAKLRPMNKSTYSVYNIDADCQIRPFVEAQGLNYRLGIAFYQLMKMENIQPQKNIAIRNKKTGTFYSGAQARNILGLPDGEQIRVKPDFNPDYDVFVQSTSVNRKLIAGTKLLVVP